MRSRPFAIACLCAATACEDASTVLDAGDANADGAFDGPSETGVKDATIEAEAGPPPLCDTNATWAAPSFVAAGPVSVDLLGQITPDELGVAWTSVVGSTPSVRWADRASAQVAFGASSVIPQNQGPFARDRVALSSDRLTLVALLAGSRQFVEFTRASASDVFGNASTAHFTTINLSMAEAPPDALFADPVFSVDGTQFLFSFFTGATTASIRVSTRPDEVSPWPLGDTIDQPELDVSGGLRRRPSGLSKDQRTLFYWDDVTQGEKAAWRPNAAAPFDFFVDLGQRIFAQPNQACTVLYFSFAGGDAGVTSPDGGPAVDWDIFSAAKQ